MKAIPRKRLSTYVEDEIVRMIVSGELEPGDKLPSERGLMERFEVGRPSVREALFAVERKGLIQLGRGDRPRVIEQNPTVLFESLTEVAQGLMNGPEGVRHFNEARLLFECALARTAATEASEEDIEALQAKLDESVGATENIAKFRKLDIEFHRLLAELPGNPIYVAIHEALVEWVVMRRVVESDAAKFNKRSLSGHEAILKALRSRSPRLAEEAMKAHLTEAEVQWAPFAGQNSASDE